MKTKTCNICSRVFWIFLPNIIKIDAYNFELYRFKVGPFLRHSVDPKGVKNSVWMARGPDPREKKCCAAVHCWNAVQSLRYAVSLLARDGGYVTVQRDQEVYSWGAQSTKIVSGHRLEDVNWLKFNVSVHLAAEVDFCCHANVSNLPPCKPPWNPKPGVSHFPGAKNLLILGSVYLLFPGVIGEGQLGDPTPPGWPLWRTAYLCTTLPWRMLSNWLWISCCGDYWQQAELRTDGACRTMMMMSVYLGGGLARFGLQHRRFPGLAVKGLIILGLISECATVIANTLFHFWCTSIYLLSMCFKSATASWLWNVQFKKYWLEICLSSSSSKTFKVT